MKDAPELFRTYGVRLVGTERPPDVVRAAMPLSALAGQYAGLGLVAAIGLAPTPLVIWLIVAMEELSASAVMGCGFVSFPFLFLWAGLCAFFIWALVRNSYVWVELTGEVLRAKRLLTGQVIKRSVLDIEDLVTLISNQDLVSRIAEQLSGRVRGATVRFHDGRTPLAITLRDPAMTNARELIEAVLFRMWAFADLDYDVAIVDGKPLVQRLSWKRVPARGGQPPSTSDATEQAPTNRSEAISPPETPPPASPPTARFRQPPPPGSS